MKSHARMLSALVCKQAAHINAMLSLLLLPAISPAYAESLNVGAAADFAILALNDGMLSINSATTITGVVGASKNVTVQSAQKVSTFNGSACIYSGTTTTSFNSVFMAATFAPNGGIQYGPGSVDAKLDQANADASKAALYYASLKPTTGPNVLGSISSSLSLTGSGGMNAYTVNSWSYNSNTLTLTGGPSDMFVFNITGSMAWAQSSVVLNGINANQVVFNFIGTSGNSVLINKSATIFKGTILSPIVPVTYHNPASFNGRIIAGKITLHSSFNITAPPAPPPIVVVKPPTGALSLTNTVFLQGVVIPVSYSITR